MQIVSMQASLGYLGSEKGNNVSYLFIVGVNDTQWSLEIVSKYKKEHWVWLFICYKLSTFEKDTTRGRFGCYPNLSSARTELEFMLDVLVSIVSKVN